jgi:hypothetical protein
MRRADRVARMRMKCMCTDFGRNTKEINWLVNLGVEGRIILE